MSSLPIDLESKLEQLLVTDDDFLVLEKEFDQFCPFEALGMVRSEVRHGNFLAYILNPDRPHGFHSDVLRAFLLAVARSALSTTEVFRLKPLDVHLMNIERAEVRREWRNIDLLIVIPTEKIVIPIELKVESSQGSDQLRRYRKIAEDEWPSTQGWRHLNVFLTKYEEDPIDAGHWQPLAISDLVKELELIAKKANGAQAGASLEAYLKMLRRHHLDDERLEEIARKLWSRHREALEFLAERQPDATGNLFEALKDRKSDIVKSLQDIGLNMALDADHRAIIRLAFTKWDDLPGFKQSTWTDSKRLVLLEVKRERTKITAYVYLGPGEDNARSKFLGILDKERLHRPKARAGKEWMCLAKAEMLNDQIDDDTDLDQSLEMVKKSLLLFARKVFDHFDPVLSRLRPNETVINIS